MSPSTDKHAPERPKLIEKSMPVSLKEIPKSSNETSVKVKPSKQSLVSELFEYSW